MQTTSNKQARALANLLAAHGVEMVVGSPGSRNTPLLLAVNRHPRLDVEMIVDERQAAFFALGHALITRKPVALVCTSGSAVLNYAPAVSEAYYRNVPLIVVSADRPSSDIDIADSQTIRQPGALANIVKASVDIPEAAPQRFAERLINDALIRAKSAAEGPVHINMHFDVPLGQLADDEDDVPVRIITKITAPTQFPSAQMNKMAEYLSSRRVMLVVGQLPPDDKFSRALSQLSTVPGYVVVAEPLANVHVRGNVFEPEEVASRLRKQTDAAPDVVITLGGALVSASLKGALRRCRNAEHWSVTQTGFLLDTFGTLRHVVDADAVDFVANLAWRARKFAKSRNHYADAFSVDNKAPVTEWSDAFAIRKIIASLTKDANLQVGNGMSVRCLEGTDYRRLHRIDANRGVSGIDGCLSTAIGAAFAYPGPTALIIGDMSMRYDIAALQLPQIPYDFRIFVMNNNGGDIFRRIPTTSGLDEREELFVMPSQIPLKLLAEAYGFNYLEANNPLSLDIALSMQSKQKTIINVITY